ncbi:MAG: DUF1080 domain-containing protein [Phycisphaerales bacterium]|nr:DUF1080 domain-containing protein [Phycisphaerales bacterium]
MLALLTTTTLTVSLGTDIIGVEARSDGVLVTCDQPVAHTALLDETLWSFDPGQVEDVIASPDGHRLFLKTGSPASGAVRFSVTSASAPALVWTGCLQANARPGPDFPASAIAVRPELDRTPPPGAVELFTGGTTERLQMKRDGSDVTWTVEGEDLVVDRQAGDVVSREPLGSGRYHIEWMSPPGGDPDRQDNGNSGVKFDSRYEIQILNTAGPPHNIKFSEAGSIYRIKAADHNASAGPGRWQVYDVWYTAPIWSQGEKVTDARMTVWWNGVKVHDDELVPVKTGWSIEEGPDPQPFLLQAHGSAAVDEVRFRNVWFVPALSRAPSLRAE